MAPKKALQDANSTARFDDFLEGLHLNSQIRVAAKVLLTIVTLMYGVLPAIADLNETHLLNPEWSSHARVHGAWFLFFGAAMAFMSLYLVWFRNVLILPVFVGLMFVAGFWVAFLAAPLYGGALVDENGIETTILALESNVFTFSVVTTVLLIVLAYEWLNRDEASV
ncbi:MAG: DUF6640 family protein [Pseudomonadota bacterium]